MMLASWIRANAVGLLLACPILAPAPAAADPLYAITSFGQVEPTNLNNAGQVAYEQGGEAFLYNSFGPEAGQWSSLGTIGGPPHTSGTFAWVNAVNDAGQAVGGATDPAAGGVRHAFLSQNGTMTSLGTLPGAGISYAMGINDSGEVTGYAYTGPGGVTVAHSFLDVGGQMTDLGTFGHAESYARAINASGQIAGDVLDGSVSHGFVYSKGQETDIGTFGGPSSFAWGINNAGQVVGGASLADGQDTHAFLYSKGMLKDLGTLGGASSWATGINDAGQVVGWSGTAGGGSPHLFLYTGGKMLDLNNLIPPNSGWVLGEGYGDPKINDAGQIIVAGSHDGRADSFALLTPSNLPAPPPLPPPVPEPSTLSFAGLVAIAGAFRLIRDRRDRAKVS